VRKIYLFNTWGRKKEVFRPLKKDFVRIYDCGPTVYFYAHIGNLWRYLVSDFLRRILEYNGYRVKQVMNITDVGHLTEDDLLAADSGEDKIEVAARKEKKTVWQIAEFYTQAYLKDRRYLNILDPHVICKATEHIPQMIALIKKLEAKGFAYRLPDRVCFDVAKFKNYGKLSGKKLEELKMGARLEPIPGKKNPYDFSLWIKDEKHLMKWDSPWGVGYPGWHIECSAMSMHYLGPQLDIHSGGEDNIFPHHENEIAQSEAVTGKRFVRYWIHVRHNLVGGKKMSKSKGNLYLLSDLLQRGFSPLSYRYLCLTNHYRSKLNFTWRALKASQKALERLRGLVAQWRKTASSPDRKAEKRWQAKFVEAINDDIGTPQGLAVMWEMIADKSLPAASKLNLVLDFDRVLGLRLEQEEKIKIPAAILKLVKEREKLREKGDFAQADKIRQQIAKKGFALQDTPEGTVVKPVVIDDHHSSSYN